MRAIRLLVVTLSSILPSLAFAGPPAPIPVEALFANPTFSRPDLSLDGKQVAYVQSQGDLQVVFALPVTGGSPTPLAKFDDPQTRLSRLEWANDHRLLISAHARDPNSLGMRNRMTRLFAVDSDGRNFAWLGRDWPVYGPRATQSQSQDRLVHLTPEDPQGVLIQYWSRKEDSPQVMRLDVDDGELTVAEQRQNRIYDWHADSRGVVRAGETTYGGKYQLWARPDTSHDFALIEEHDQLEWSGLEFAGFHRDPRRLYVSTLRDDRLALFEFDLETRSLGQLVEAHPEVNVSTVATIEPGGEVVGVRYTDDRRRIRFFDERTQTEYDRLRETLETELGRVLEVEPVSASADGMKQVLAVSSDRQPPVYYLYDRTPRRIERMFSAFPEVPVESLAPARRITFRARDGLAVPAYLTVPLGIEPSDLPAVALVHGGPWSRDQIEWDPEVQLLASRGFAVLQINYRGSSGFGKAFRDAGDREWGQKIQDDITDGVQWLIAEGIADADRIGIMGTSYGGYAALVGLVKTPNLFRAGVAYAAVTDIEWTLGDDRWYGSSDALDRKLIGGEIGDAQRLRASSPLRRAGEIRVPVLIGHGEDDQRVHVRQSQSMADALKALGKPYEYLEFPNEIHGFALESNRIRWYTRVADFLEENLAPRTAAAVP